MQRSEVLRQAEQIVTSDRTATHGPPEDNFALIAELWGVYLNVALSSHDVAVLMVLLKIARIRATPRHTDHWLDIAGYAACGAEVATK